MRSIEYKMMLRFQKFIYLNLYLSTIWVIVEGIFLYMKRDILGHLVKYLSITVFSAFLVIQFIRLYLGKCGTINSRVPELAGYLIISVLLQMPVLSYFLFNPHLLSTPTEVTLNSLIWVLTAVEIIFGVFTLKTVSSIAKCVYMAHSNPLSVNLDTIN